jgi:hypothetical protein
LTVVSQLPSLVFQRVEIQHHRSGDGDLAGLSSFFVAARASARLCFPNSDTAISADRLAVYSENPGEIYPGLLSGLGHLPESRRHYLLLWPWLVV